MSTVEILVPDLGDFKDVLVAEIFVKDGDLVEVEQPIASVESDKATMDIPSPSSGVLKRVKVALGDRVSKGSLLAVLETSSSVEENPSPADGGEEEATSPVATTIDTPLEGIYDLVVIGGVPRG